MGGGSVRADILFVRIDVEVAGDGSSWSTAYDDLQAALAVAQPGDEIWVAVGVYRPSQPDNPDDLRTATFRLRQGVAVYGGFAGTEASRAERAGRRDQQHHRGELTLISCRFEANSAEQGGAIHTLTGSTTTLDTCTLVGNSAGSGGAVFNSFGSNATLTGCTLSNNSAGQGGAMLQKGGVATLTDCRIAGNGTALRHISAISTVIN